MATGLEPMMFDSLSMAPPDAILGLSEAFKKDSNPNKINLSVGVYQDATGATPVLKCVHEAEKRAVAANQTKSYLAISGLPDYNSHVQELLFGKDHEVSQSARAATVQTPGGTGALRVAADFLHSRFPNSSIWCSKPTWANHPSVFAAAGLQVHQYAYIDETGRDLDFEAMLDSLQKIPAGDIVCLHACCHNPTGIDPTVDQWQQIADVVYDRKLLPLVDFAYQGFGDGLLEDRVGLHTMIRPNCEMLICNSFSKNFGLYGERVGGMTVVGESAEVAQISLSHVKMCVRCNYSNPPKHGALVVATVLGDPELRTLWERELAEMRDRIHQMRQLFVETLAKKGVTRDFSHITRQRGMFSFSGLTPVQVDQLRSEYSIYIVGSGRINVAGMTESNMDQLCTAIAAVIG